MTDKGGTHPTYVATSMPALIGDDVALRGQWPDSAGVVTDIHGQTFGDGPGDTITIIPAAVTLSTGERCAVADLVLLRRADS